MSICKQMGKTEEQERRWKVFGSIAEVRKNIIRSFKGHYFTHNSQQWI